MSRPAAPPLCLITRPEPAASAFAGRVGDIGLRTLVAPLQRIAPTTARMPEGARGVILTSAHGAAQLRRLGVPRDMPCFAVGTKTADAARAAGYTAQSAEGDAEALIAMLRADPPAMLLVHVRGTHTTGAVAERLTTGGVQTMECIAYQQLATPLSPEAQAALTG
ncbi:MAG: uroporphyrinogen-III synthase, partial [Shimia sp.]